MTVKQKSGTKRIVLPENLQKKAADFPEIRMNVQFLTLVDKSGVQYEDIQIIGGRIALVPSHLSGKDIKDVLYKNTSEDNT